ncbi:MAG: GIY-YIG nuclease family protein [Candidatus Margulisbacteria bacterium]|nr:GIY-YIG nuclease family protein [Candidatus Margulisiibacteriota bacterium]
MYYVYVLHSLSYNTYYVGSTEDTEKRLSEHNAGKCRYTSGRMPWQLVYKEEYNTRGEAMKREKFFKSGQGRKFLKEKVLITPMEG